MAKLKANSDAPSQFVGLRLDRDTAQYYSKRAQERGSSLSEFLRNMIVQGMIADTALDVEQRLRAVLAEIGQPPQPADALRIPESVLQSIFTSEFLLSAIVESRNIQELYEAQNKARARIAREKGAGHAAR